MACIWMRSSASAGANHKYAYLTKFGTLYVVSVIANTQNTAQKTLIYAIGKAAYAYISRFVTTIFIGIPNTVSASAKKRRHFLL